MSIITVTTLNLFQIFLNLEFTCVHVIPREIYFLKVESSGISLKHAVRSLVLDCLINKWKHNYKLFVGLKPAPEGDMKYKNKKCRSYLGTYLLKSGTICFSTIRLATRFGFSYSFHCFVRKRRLFLYTREKLYKHFKSTKLHANEKIYKRWVTQFKI